MLSLVICFVSKPFGIPLSIYNWQCLGSCGCEKMMCFCRAHFKVFEIQVSYTDKYLQTVIYSPICQMKVHMLTKFLKSER